MDINVECQSEVNEMSRRINTSVQQTVETPVVQPEVTDNEQTKVENTVENTSVEEQTEMDTNEETPWKVEIDKLDIEGVKLVMKYCQSRLEELQKDAIQDLEQQMRDIQMKLLNMKGGSLPERANKKGLIIVNPNNPNEMYKGFGKRPVWLLKLLEPANGSREKEREIMEGLAKKN